MVIKKGEEVFVRVNGIFLAKSWTLFNARDKRYAEVQGRISFKYQTV